MNPKEANFDIPHPLADNGDVRVVNDKLMFMAQSDDYVIVCRFGCTYVRRRICVLLIKMCNNGKEISLFFYDLFCT